MSPAAFRDALLRLGVSKLQATALAAVVDASQLGNAGTSPADPGVIASKGLAAVAAGPAFSTTSTQTDEYDDILPQPSLTASTQQHNHPANTFHIVYSDKTITQQQQPQQPTTNTNHNSTPYTVTATSTNNNQPSTPYTATTPSTTTTTSTQFYSMHDADKTRRRKRRNRQQRSARNDADDHINDTSRSSSSSSAAASSSKPCADFARKSHKCYQ